MKARPTRRQTGHGVVYWHEETYRMGKTHNEYMQARRKKAKEAGMCPQHIHNKIVEGTATCQVCIDAAQQKYAQAKLTGVCQQHPLRPVAKGRVLCGECLDKNAKKRKKRTADSKLINSCTFHLTRPAEIGTRCEECWYRDMSAKALKTGTRWKEIKDLLKAQDFLCAYTGAKLIPGDDASIDHIIPRAKGGKNEMENLQWVTDLVNLSKFDITHERFLYLIALVVKNLPKE